MVIKIWHYALFSFLLTITVPTLLSATSISINAPKEVIKEPVTLLAISDVQKLLAEACACNVRLNSEKADIQINLPIPTLAKFDKIRHKKNDAGVPFFYYPSTKFEWKSLKKDGRIELDLMTDSYEGISAALYALLQEKLGFRFYHPRKMIVPSIEEWSLPKYWRWIGEERFNKRGFHLHTMHPIELTEALLDPEHPDGQKMVFEYIDWLARNGQNYFEFNLLSSINLDAWLPYAKKFVDYAHQRGIVMGLDISLHMIQQRAFRLYENKPTSFEKKDKQIVTRLDSLAQANWDVYNIELSSTEYTSGNKKQRELLQQVILDWASENKAKIMGRAHVVKKGEEVLNYGGKDEEEVKDPQRGVMIHTVMFYEVAEDKAPVYGNKNLQHMLELMEQEKTKRETWYFPESAYWVTFDNSVPMLLLPYLSARLNDILLAEEKGITGHLTFSSGWEWSYWLVDWSIARWSWNYGKNVEPLDGLKMLLSNDEALVGIEKILHLQQKYLKDQELIRYVVAQSVMDEVPKMFAKEFHPRPHWRYKDLYQKADGYILDSLRTSVIIPLREFGEAYDSVLTDILYLQFPTMPQKLIYAELLDGLYITQLRVMHRHHCLNAIFEHRKGTATRNKQRTFEPSLQEASQYRNQALQIVRRREKHYAYDLPLLTTKRPGHTAYQFGYLYTVSNLHFWKREEAQIKENNWGFGFMNIWDIERIIGLKK